MLTTVSTSSLESSGANSQTRPELLEGLLNGTLQGRERDVALWTFAADTLATLDQFQPLTLRARPHNVPRVETLRDWLDAERNGGKPDTVVSEGLRAWSDWRVQVTHAEAENAGKLAGLLSTAQSLIEMCERYPEASELGKARDQVLVFLRAEYRVKRVPDNVAQRQWIARVATKRLDVMSNEYRDPEWREVVE